ncbi:MAG: hypothetical protein WCJ40_10135 [Planctomycetota bacterium]
MPRAPIDYKTKSNDIICYNLTLLGEFRTGTDKNTKLQIDNEGRFTRRTGFWSFKGREVDDSLLSDFTIGSLKSLFDFAYKCMSEPKNKDKLDRALYLKAFSGLSCLGDYYRQSKYDKTKYLVFVNLLADIKTRIEVKLLQIVKTTTLDAGWFPSFGRVSTQNPANKRSAASLERFGQSDFKTDGDGICFGISLDWCRRVVVKKNYSFINSRKVTTQLPLSNKDRFTAKGVRQAVIQMLQFKLLKDEQKFNQELVKLRNGIAELKDEIKSGTVLVFKGVMLETVPMSDEIRRKYSEQIIESEKLLSVCTNPNFITKLHLENIDFAPGTGVVTIPKVCKFDCKDADEFNVPLRNLISIPLTSTAIQAFMLIFSFETDGGHAMAFAKDGTDFIGMDPNFGEFKCQNVQDLVFIFSVILSYYNLTENISRLEFAKVSPKPGTLLDN